MDSDGSVKKFQCPLKMDELCLGGRYGEDLAAAIASGRATGQLKNYALKKGFSGVAQYLEAIGKVLPKGKKLAKTK
ncbi:hypothetical protein HDU67_009787 [Dinochytrium kinnereticum]|nr:hypothetical protein HDU67_009787 [Dinochytrium kinnereticum]